MATFGRTAAQDVIWERLNAIKNLYAQPGNLQEPDDGLVGAGYTQDEIDDLQDEWDDIVETYADAHEANDTFG